MRSAIFFGLIIVATAIKPDILGDDNSIRNLAYVVWLLFGMDVIELLSRFK
jgi:hypothetical protein